MEQGPALSRLLRGNLSTALVPEHHICALALTLAGLQLPRINVERYQAQAVRQHLILHDVSAGQS